MGLVKTARSLNKLKDVFAEVGPKVIMASHSKMPTHTVLDNLDFMGEHLMLKCTMREQVDTSQLSTEPMAKLEALKLFDKSQLLIGSPGLKEERRHLLEDVIANGWGHIIAKWRVNRAGKLATYL